MNSKIFSIPSDYFTKKRSTVINQKTRLVLKCYALREFNLLEDNTFTCVKTHKIKGITISDKKVLTGFYEDISDDGTTKVIRITVN